MSGTLTAASDPTRRAARRPTLTLLVECTRPLAGPAQWLLDGFDEVRLGRGPAREARRSEEDLGTALSIGLPDQRMSEAHARLVPLGGRWILEDRGSKNGTRVNGAPERRVGVRPGDVIEVGETLFLYSEDEDGDEDAPANGDALPGVQTLSRSFGRALARLALVARSDVPVILGGESGTGKEVCARAIHALSGRPGRFVAVNSGALPEALVESELFGSRKGAFSGATEDRPGLVRTADRGTLFLDEIADLPLAAQPTLLRVLQEREVTPIGGARPVKVDLRVVCATHQDLTARAQDGRFRADLLARLSGFELALPPLRERREDLGLLLPALLRKVAPARVARLSLTVEAGRALVRHGWPLNVRELEQALAAAAALASRDRIELAHLPAAVQPAARPGPAPGEEPEAPLSEEEARQRDELTAVLRRHGGNLAAVARELGKDRRQIHRWIQRYRIDPDRYRP